LPPKGKTRQIKGPSEKVVLDPRKVFDPTPSNEDHRVFLKRMSLPRNVSRQGPAIGQPEAGDLSKGRVGFLGVSDKDP